MLLSLFPFSRFVYLFVFDAKVSNGPLSEKAGICSSKTAPKFPLTFMLQRSRHRAVAGRRWVAVGEALVQSAHAALLLSEAGARFVCLSHWAQLLCLPAGLGGCFLGLLSRRTSGACGILELSQQYCSDDAGLQLIC